jgi:hypothetical protein
MLSGLPRMRQASAASVCRFEVCGIQTYLSLNAGRLYHTTPRHDTGASAISIRQPRYESLDD